MDYKHSYSQWLASDELDAQQKARLESASEDEIKEMFWSALEFGTAGMRGVLDVGTNRMNFFTVKRATKGLADYVATLGEEAKRRGIVVSYDTRRFSTEFAIKVAKVLAANGVQAYLYEDVRPVPMCSFAIRRLNAVGAVMITASHNPKIYNGYKVYGDDGAQMSPEATDKVVEFIDKTPYFGINEISVDIEPKDIRGLDNCNICENITVIGKSVDEDYFAAIEKLGLSNDAVAKYGSNVKIVYTPIHGSGYMPVTTILGRMGIKVNVVEEQAAPDAEFSTVRVPNPEEADTLKLGVELADRINSDVVIGTDPDADRMGIAIRNSDGKFVLLNGNQIGVLMCDYIFRRKNEEGIMPKNGALVKTIVTTELARKIADFYNVTTFDVLTGFKFIGEKIKEWEKTEEYTYLFGFEESYGSLIGTHARDKDAVVASMIFAEMICYYESKDMRVWDVLEDIYAKYGYFVEKSISVTFSGIDGMAKMKEIMLSLRTKEYSSIAGTSVLAVCDFVDGIKKNVGGTIEKLTLPRTNALKLLLANGDWICVRPSGTEPKLKFYVATSKASLEEATSLAQQYLSYMKNLTE